MKFKSTIFLLVFLCTLLLWAAEISLTHPANDITMEFDKDTNILKVKIYHLVDATSKHYIEEIKVLINGQTAVIQYFKKQSNKKFQEASFLLIDASLESTIRIEAKCNRFGSFKKDFDLKE